ncbi:Sec1 family protein [Oesophagostomum dentatum]|uniref:Sec1 family protein n=1 Tax=Oesophagostomum dentatum TaxID=61180 RepID=A0A0B1SXM1_OESDE|nr:Sec1 family protein [Oesophagostomum dentatum]
MQRKMTDLCEQPLGLLSEVARRELVHLLESLPGTKDLIVDATLLRPLDRIASMSLLQKHGCQRVIPLRLESSTAIPWNQNALRRVYLLRSSLDMARLLAQHVRSSPENRQIAVIWVDRRLVICERELERQGVYGLVESFELSISLISLENDLFSMEMPITTAQKDLLAPANALFQLQSLYGLIPTVYGLGEQTEKLWKLMHHVYDEKGEPRCGKISFGPEVEAKMRPDVEQGEAVRKSKVYVLDNNDGVFASIRNKHMTGVFPFLSSKAKEIQSDFHKGASIDQVQDMKQFVAHELKALKLQHRQLEMHICACEVLLEKNGAAGAGERLRFEHALVAGTANIADVVSYLEDCMLRELPSWQVLSLACLASLSQNGLPPKHYQSFREHFFRTYGYEYLPILHSLASKRLLIEKPRPIVGGTIPPAPSSPSPNDSLPTLPFLIKRLGLVPTSEDATVDLKNPSTMSYVFSGAFTPPFCQVVANAMVHGWNTNELKKTFGRSFREHFFRTYGYEYLPILHSLASKRLLIEKPRPIVGGTIPPAPSSPSPNDSLPTLPFLIKRLGLVPTSEDATVDLKNPSAMSYVFSGAFTPPFCQVVANAMVHGWNTNELKKTFGRVLVEENSYIPADRRPDNRMRKAILVFFLGGVTYAEVAALRLLAVQNNFRILIASTNIIHRDSYMKYLSELDYRTF